MWCAQIEVGNLNVSSTSPLAVTPAASNVQGKAEPHAAVTAPLPWGMPEQLGSYLGPMMQSLGNSAPGHILADASGAPKFRQNRAAVHAPTSAPLPAGSAVALHSTAPAAGAAAVSGLGAPCSALDQLPIPAASAPLPAMLPEHTDSEAKAALPSAGAPQILRADNLRSAHAPATPRPLAEAPAQGHLLLAATSGTAFPTSVPVRALAPSPRLPGWTGGTCPGLRMTWLLAPQTWHRTLCSRLHEPHASACDSHVAALWWSSWSAAR